MSFQRDELERLRRYAGQHFDVDHHVLPRELAHETLHESFRQQAIEYFDRHGIKWWTSRFDAGEPLGLLPVPTGHLNSSQVACVNHLEPARADPRLALAIARNVNGAIDEMLPVEDGGYVAYEWIGARDYLGEGGRRTRGANVTSLDALMVARRNDETILLAFEWKYLERYGAKSRAFSSGNTDRIAIYRALLERPDCPIAVADPAFLFYDPYEQLMRQTLLAWQMTEARELDASDWLHIHVIPDLNVALRSRQSGAAPDLVGESMADAWRSALTEPTRYRLHSPSEILAGVEAEEWQEWRTWIHDRYLT